MSLIVTVDKPLASVNEPDRCFLRPAGYEGYQSSLWASQSIIRRSRFLPRIHHGLEVLPADFDEFEEECRLIDQEAKQIAFELRKRHRAGQIRTYMKHFLDAVQFARQHDSECIRIG